MTHRHSLPTRRIRIHNLLLDATPVVKDTAVGDVANVVSPFVVAKGGVMGSTLPTDGSGGVDAAV